jgi:hypothetical protein
MLTYNDDKHSHLPTEDWPPNINKGPLRKGLHKELPKRVVCGCCESLPSPTFMGFKEK